jgi:hypothetical protein
LNSTGDHAAAQAFRAFRYEPRDFDLLPVGIANLDAVTAV